MLDFAFCGFLGVLELNPDFEQRIERLDLTLFDAKPSQSDAGDRTSWLVLQRAIRRVTLQDTYLEIGSHLGGSIQQHLVDPRCSLIYSIDKRPQELPDDRGMIVKYEGNSTTRMMDNLRAIAPEATTKVVCFDADAREIDPGLIKSPPDYCFIDGEHTKRVVLSDFTFCFRVCASNAVIAFHDDWFIYPALADIVKFLDAQGVIFLAYKMQGATFAFALRKCSAISGSSIHTLSVDGVRWLRQKRFTGLAKRFIPEFMQPAARQFYRLLVGYQKPANLA